MNFFAACLCWCTPSFLAVHGFATCLSCVTTYCHMPRVFTAEPQARGLSKDRQTPYQVVSFWASDHQYFSKGLHLSLTCGKLQSEDPILFVWSSRHLKRRFSKGLLQCSSISTSCVPMIYCNPQSTVGLLFGSAAILRSMASY